MKMQPEELLDRRACSQASLHSIASRTAPDGRGRLSSAGFPLIAITTLIASGCGGAGGLNFWLYPEPRLESSEEALFLAHESHGLQAIDGQETETRCWGHETETQAYRQRNVLCRLHIRPGEHTVVFSPGVSSRERKTITFTALPGKAYGLDRSECSTSAEGRRQTCRVRVVELDSPAGDS